MVDRERLDDLLASAAGWLVCLVPWTLMVGAAPVDIVCVGVDVLFISSCILRRDFAWTKAVWFKVCVALWAFSVVRTLFIWPPNDGLGFALSWCRFFILGAAVAHWILVKKEWCDRLAISVAIVCAAFAIDGIWQSFSGRDILGHPVAIGRLTGTLSRPRLGITIASLMWPAVLWLYGEGRRSLAAGLCLLDFVAIALSGDRFAFVIAVGALILLLFLVAEFRARALLMFATVAGVFGALFYVRPDVFARQIQSTTQFLLNIGATHYGIIWKRVLVIAGQHPFFGVGLNQYRRVCGDLRYGPIEQIDALNTACTLHAHNFYLEWLVECGIIGVALFTAITIIIGYRLFKKWHATPADLVLLGLAITWSTRLFPIETTTGYMRSWSAVPLWLYAGWGLALAAPVIAKSFPRTTSKVGASK